MLLNFLQEVVILIVGKQAEDIADLLNSKKHVNEFIIAKKLDITINQTRNILYKLSDYGLVSFIRKKDKRKGWYIYFWTLNVFQSLSLLEDKLKKELGFLDSQLKSRTEKRYYVCQTCSIEVTEDAALLNDFTCPECEEVYELNDNPEIIEQLKKASIRIRREIKLVIVEREKEGEKIEKKKAKEIKKAEEERKIKRAAKRKENAMIKAKELAKLGKAPKKKVKKKPAEKKKKVKKKPAKKKKVAKKKFVKKKVSKLLGKLKKKKKK